MSVKSLSRHNRRTLIQQLAHVDRSADSNAAIRQTIGLGTSGDDPGYVAHSSWTFLDPCPDYGTEGQADTR
jgi:hypothetical protein